LTKSDGPPFASLRLVADSLTCERGGRTVFSALSFTIRSGEALIVTGPNGAGKSSLLRLVAGLVDPAGGGLSLEGGNADLGIGEQAHYIGHLDALKPAMTVRQTLRFWSDFLGGSDVDTQRALDVFDLVALVELPVAYLSAGQRRRLSLARLCLAQRPLWLLDEPTVALDAASLARLVGVMEAHLERGGLVLAATHQPLGLERMTALDLASERIRA
jgi:heme exporter protein A